jgi:hypothetical protein
MWTATRAANPTSAMVPPTFAAPADPEERALLLGCATAFDKRERRPDFARGLSEVEADTDVESDWLRVYTIGGEFHEGGELQVAVLVRRPQPKQGNLEATCHP